MSSTTLNSLSLPRSDQPSVSAALQELLVAGRHLAVALWQAAFVRNTAIQRQLTIAEEAAALRRYAASIYRSERGLAQDLMAAADRHEGL